MCLAAALAGPLGAAAPQGIGGGDARTALGLLDEPDAAARARGERWLAARLAPSDFEAVADALRGADAETRGRIVRALARDERHLDLAARLSVDYDPPVARAGEAAIAALAERWTVSDPTEPFRPQGGEEVGEELVRRFTYIWSMAIPAASLERAVDRLSRVGLGRERVFSRVHETQLVLSPELYAEERRLTEVRTLEGLTVPENVHRSGPVAGLLEELRRAHGARIEGFDLGGSHPWVLVAERGELGRFAPEELCARWCRTVLQHPDRPLGAGAARALAAMGWPAALAWLEMRWSEAGDRNALSGLLLGAARGRVAPGIATAAFVGDMLRRADRELASPDVESLVFATDVQRALAGLGRLGAAGEDLAPVLVDGFEQASAAELWLRLAVLEGWGHVPASVRTVLVEALRDPQGAWKDARLRLRALHALAASESPPAVVVAQPASLFVAARTSGGRELLLEALERLAADPPEPWRDAGTRAPFDRSAHWIFEWWLGRGALDVAAAHLAGLLEETDERGLRLLERRLSSRAEAGARETVRAVLERSREELSQRARGAWRLVALEADCLAPGDEQELLTQALARGRTDVLLLGALAGRPGGGEAVERVLASLEASLADPGQWTMGSRELRAAERALVGLRRAGLDERADRVEREVRRLYREAEHPQFPYLATGAWPPRPGLRPRELEALDPALEEVWAAR